MTRINRVAVVIPLYKEVLSDSEWFSISNTFSVLSSWDVIFVVPERMKGWISEQVVAKFNPTDCHYFSDNYFESIDGYNRLLLSKKFYKSFERYEYILLVQADALIISDQLNYWCDAGYSYIGAPWFFGYGKPVEPITMIGVGNGGFSLRKTEDFLRALRLPVYFSKLFFDKKINLKNIYSSLQSFKNEFFGMKKYFGHAVKYNEDEYWGLMAPRYFDYFKVPDPEKAAYFSFEVSPRYLYESLGKLLPFGCHAWEKYDYEFWSEVLQQRGMDLPKLKVPGSRLLDPSQKDQF